ncbi:hypothetical protein V6R21_19890 [Limibacter armeniacum]|uniref:hypothetical protein n=1 Tax=Limibacter armeniacum TaxID=466084 RepID=UPI002FE6791E
MITKKHFSDYMLDVATRLKDIGHTPEKPRFARNGEEFLNLISGKMKVTSGVMLVLDAYNNQLVHNNDDQFNLVKTPSFFLVRGINDETDYNAEEEVYDECEKVLMKILAKMKAERYTVGNLMRFFDLNGTTYRSVGPLDEGQNLFGIEVQLRFSNVVNADLVYDEADWL